MQVSQWMSWYHEILQKFGFNQEEDETSARYLNNLLEKNSPLKIEDIHIKDCVVVFGAGPSLKDNIKTIKPFYKSFTSIVADGATTALLEENIIPDIVVTDLDGKMDSLDQSSALGAVMVVHAHGDNLEKIKLAIDNFNRVIGTTQSTPLKHVHNFGGFTDGDRAVFLAVALGARIIILAGMDFGKITTQYSRPELGVEIGPADNIKQLKLQYAKDLVEWAASNLKVPMFNLSRGENLEGIKRIDSTCLAELLQ